MNDTVARRPDRIAPASAYVLIVLGAAFPILAFLNGRLRLPHLLTASVPVLIGAAAIRAERGRKGRWLWLLATAAGFARYLFFPS